MNELQTVEVRFYGERLATVTLANGAYTLYRTPDGSYFVYIDEGEEGAHLVTGGSTAMPRGQLNEGISEANAREFWPELLAAADLD
ncbi:MAG: hypothetical protein LC740_16090 [Actinobacteria bacterium]|nr:hypothetical protein [Actinomycetota bacterium]